MYFEGCSSDIYQKNTSIIFDSSKIPSAGLCQELCSDQLELNGIFWFALQVLTFGHHFFNSTINDTFASTLILIIFYQQQVVMWTTYIIFFNVFQKNECFCFKDNLKNTQRSFYNCKYDCVKDINEVSDYVDCSGHSGLSIFLSSKYALFQTDRNILKIPFDKLLMTQQKTSTIKR